MAVDDAGRRRQQRRVAIERRLERARRFADAAHALATYEFERQVGSDGVSSIVMEPVGVSGLFAPWNSTAGTMCGKLASAIAAGCATVIKPSELSPWQAHVVTRALHDAGLPPGVVNVVTQLLQHRRQKGEGGLFWMHNQDSGLAHQFILS